MSDDLDLTTLDDDELVSLNQQLGRQKDAIREQQLAINAELTARAKRRRAEQVLAGLDADEVRIVLENAAGMSAGGRELG